MRLGEKYERFVYEKLKRLLPEFDVRVNDKILGKQSGLLREIDISIRATIGRTDLLYIVQCKDYRSRPADITTLGEFSATVQDVAAAKGILLCTSGFATTNHRYARTLGIDLITIEDINSDEWKVEIQIPLVYIKNTIRFELSFDVIVNDELARKNTQPVSLAISEATLLSRDGGASVMTMREHLDAVIVEEGFDVRQGGRLALARPDLMIQLVDVWVECQDLEVVFKVAKTTHLKYVTPEEYSQLRDHIGGGVLPLHLSVKGTFGLDESYVEIPSGHLPVFTDLSIEIEEWP